MGEFVDLRKLVLQALLACDYSPALAGVMRESQPGNDVLSLFTILLIACRAIFAGRTAQFSGSWLQMAILRSDRSDRFFGSGKFVRPSMNGLRWTLVAALTIHGLCAGPAIAEEKTSSDVASAFWKAFLDGDPDEMGKHYAPRVTLKAGSELLKSEYTINATGDRGKDLTVDRKTVLRGYRVMFGRVGKEKWIESGQKLRTVQLSFISAADNNRYFALFNASPGELLVQVHTEPEPLFFLLQQDDKRRWQVVAEAFD